MLVFAPFWPYFAAKRSANIYLFLLKIRSEQIYRRLCDGGIFVHPYIQFVHSFFDPPFQKYLHFEFSPFVPIFSRFQSASAPSKRLDHNHKTQYV